MARTVSPEISSIVLRQPAWIDPTTRQTGISDQAGKAIGVEGRERDSRFGGQIASAIWRLGRIGMRTAGQIRQSAMWTRRHEPAARARAVKARLRRLAPRAGALRHASSSSRGAVYPTLPSAGPSPGTRRVTPCRIQGNGERRADRSRRKQERWMVYRSVAEKCQGSSRTASSRMIWSMIHSTGARSSVKTGASVVAGRMLPRSSAHLATEPRSPGSDWASRLSTKSSVKRAIGGEDQRIVVSPDIDDHNIAKTRASSLTRRLQVDNPGRYAQR